LRLSDLAAQLDCRLDGDGTIEITGATGLEYAGPGQITFFGNPKLKAQLDATRASAVIVPNEAPAIPQAALRSPHPYLTFARALTIFHPRPRPAPGVSPHALIDEGVVLGEGVSIGPFVTIARGARIGARTIIAAHVSIGAETVIGEDCDIRAHVSICHRVTLGQRVIVYEGVVIGSDGFGYAPTPDGHYFKIPQVGTVVVEDDVEIGANSTIDRASLGETRIGAGTKIDNLVQIAHSCFVGRDVILSAQVGLAGSTTIEDRVTLAGQVGVAGHLTIGKGAIVTAQSGVPNSIPAGAIYSGYPSIDNRDWRKASVLFARLPELRKQIMHLEERLAALEAQLADGKSRRHSETEG
jgi:UDP-3-O-[3-hydroxymyristoyl] glucosamine N-acyltransferase